MFLHITHSITPARFLFAGETQHFITTLIKKNTRVDCEYTLHRFSINKNGHIFGRIVGECSCCSSIECFITKQHSIVQIECVMTRGTDGLRCGMRATRACEPPKSGNKRKAKTSNKGQGEAHEQVTPGSGEEGNGDGKKSRPWEQDMLHNDPIYALQLLKTYKMHGELTIIQPEPLTVCYATRHQIAIYRSLYAKGHLRLIVVGIPSLIESVQGPEHESGPVIFYHVAAAVPDPVSLTQMLSESTEPFRIASWLNRWIEDNGLGIPTEVITDGQPQITAACVRIFTGYRSMNEYSNLFFENRTRSCCVVRIDAAFMLQRYMKIFAVLQEEHVVECYTNAIATLTFCEKRQDAEKVIRALLTVSLSMHEGAAADGTTSATEHEQEVLLKLPRDNIGKICNSAEFEQVMNIGGTCDRLLLNPDDDCVNDWYSWGQNILSSVKESIANRSGDPSTQSPYWLETLCPVLIDDIRWIPLWTGIASAESASVENPALVAPAQREVQAFKSSVGVELFPIRPDIFVEKYKAYIDGSKNITLVDEMTQDTPDHFQFDPSAEVEESASSELNVSDNTTFNMSGDINPLGDNLEPTNTNDQDTEGVTFSGVREETVETTLGSEEDRLDDLECRNDNKQNISETIHNATLNITGNGDPFRVDEEASLESHPDQDGLNEPAVNSPISSTKQPRLSSKLGCCSSNETLRGITISPCLVRIIH